MFSIFFYKICSLFEMLRLYMKHFCCYLLFISGVNRFYSFFMRARRLYIIKQSCCYRLKKKFFSKFFVKVLIRTYEINISTSKFKKNFQFEEKKLIRAQGRKYIDPTVSATLFFFTW